MRSGQVYGKVRHGKVGRGIGSVEMTRVMACGGEDHTSVSF